MATPEFVTYVARKDIFDGYFKYFDARKDVLTTFLHLSDRKTLSSAQIKEFSTKLNIYTEMDSKIASLIKSGPYDKTTLRFINDEITSLKMINIDMLKYSCNLNAIIEPTSDENEIEDGNEKKSPQIITPMSDVIAALDKFVALRSKYYEYLPNKMFGELGKNSNGKLNYDKTEFKKALRNKDNEDHKKVYGVYLKCKEKFIKVTRMNVAFDEMIDNGSYDINMIAKNIWTLEDEMNDVPQTTSLKNCGIYEQYTEDEDD